MRLVELMEITNGARFVMSVFVSFIFLAYICMEVRNNGFERYRLQAAFALLTYFIGELIARAYVWMWLTRINDGLPTEPVTKFMLVFIVGNVIAAWGCLCIARVFGNALWRPWVWAMMGMVTLTIAFGTALRLH